MSRTEENNVLALVRLRGACAAGALAVLAAWGGGGCTPDDVTAIDAAASDGDITSRDGTIADASRVPDDTLCLESSLYGRRCVSGRDLDVVTRRVESGNVYVEIADSVPGADALLPSDRRFVLTFQMPDGAGVPYAVRDLSLIYDTVYRCDEDSRSAPDGSCITQTNTDDVCEFHVDAAAASLSLTIDAQDPSHVAGSGHLPVEGADANSCCFYECFGRTGPGPYTLYEEWVDVSFNLRF